MVNYIKTGKSLFENNEINEYHIPIFKEAKLRNDLTQLINKSQDEISVTANQQNLKLIECLSPQKLPKKGNRQNDITQFQTEVNLPSLDSKQGSMMFPMIINRRRSSINSNISIQNQQKKDSLS